MYKEPAVAALPIPTGRPNTIPPPTLLAIDSNELASMTDDELIDIASDKLGIVFERGTKRTKVIQAIIGAAIACSDS